MTPGVYDNPDTMCREVYAHGFLVTYYTPEILKAKYATDPIQVQFLKEVLQYGEFNEGMRYGNILHIPENTSAATPYDFNGSGEYR